MKQELQPFLLELCHLAVTRNAINTRRHRARFRKNYYAHAVRVVEALNTSNYELRRLKNFNKGAKGCKWTARRDEILAEMKRVQDKYVNHKRPIKWETMGLHKLRSLVLQGEGEYAMAKHETMEFSIKHRTRVKYISTALQCSTSYDNGAITSICIAHTDTWYDLEEIHHYAEQYELNRAVEGMLKEKL